MPSCELAREKAAGLPVVDLAVTAGVARSKGEARRLADSGGLYVNNERVGVADVVSDGHVIDGQMLVLRSGRKNYCVVRVGG